MHVKPLLTMTALMLTAWLTLASCGKTDKAASGGAATAPSEATTSASSGVPDAGVGLASGPVDLSSRSYQSEFDGLNQLRGLSYHVAQGDVRISYSYDGEFGNYNIADTAVASLNGQKIAEAKTISIQRHPGEPTQVRETHFAGDGTVSYTGLLSFGDIGCVRLESEQRLSGTRRYRIFTQWPLAAGPIRPCPFATLPTATAVSQAQQPQQTEMARPGYWLDPSTGLMWATRVNGEYVTWSTAGSYCANSALGGYTGWRLPEIHELEAIFGPPYGPLSSDMKPRSKGSIVVDSTATLWSGTTQGSNDAEVLTLFSGPGVTYVLNSGLALCVRQAERGIAR